MFTASQALTRSKETPSALIQIYKQKALIRLDQISTEIEAAASDGSDRLITTVPTASQIGNQALYRYYTTVLISELQKAGYWTFIGGGRLAISWSQESQA